MTIPWNKFKQKIPDSITQDFLKYKFTYVDETGDLIFNSNGKIAGSLTTRGYLRTYILGRRIPNHWIVWMMHYGEWPKDQLDHINQTRSDNRISNLREADHELNSLNKGIFKKNTSGYPGLKREGNKWRAVITINYKQISLGTYAKAEDAYAAYAEAKNKRIMEALSMRSISPSEYLNSIAPTAQPQAEQAGGKV